MIVVKFVDVVFRVLILGGYFLMEVRIISVLGVGVNCEFGWFILDVSGGYGMVFV